jgi:hypothetical protein
VISSSNSSVQRALASSSDRRSHTAAQGRLLLWAVAVAVALGACTGDDATPPLPEPVEVESCDDVIDVGVQLLEVWVAVVEELPVEQLLADQPPPEFEELAEIGAELDARATRLGCDPVETNGAIRAEIAERGAIDPEGPVAEMVLDLVAGGVVGDLPATSSTTPVTSPGGDG